jgi:hypothetical protein
MSKKWCLLLAAMFACVVVGAVSLYPKPDEMKIAFDRVQVGMFVAEVEDIFGKNMLLQRDSGIDRGIAYDYLWRTNNNGDTALIEFQIGSVRGKEWIDSPNSLTARIRRWLPFLKE